MTRLIDNLAMAAADLIDAADDRAEAEALALAARTGGDGGMEATLRLARLIGEAAEPADALGAAEAMQDGDAATTAAALAIGCFAAVRIEHAARQDATATRTRVAAMAERAYPAVGTAGADALAWCVAMASAAVRHLSAEAASRVPVVRVETGISLPSSLLAWDLYADPARGAEIAARNASGTPLLMPAGFEALGA